MSFNIQSDRPANISPYKYHCGQFIIFLAEVLSMAATPSPLPGSVSRAWSQKPQSVRGDKRTVPLRPTGSDRPVTLTCFPGSASAFTVTPLTSGNNSHFVDIVLLT